MDGGFTSSILSSTELDGSSTSVPTADMMVFPRMCLATSVTPIGRTPGHLSRAISLQDIKADSPLVQPAQCIINVPALLVH